MQTITIQLNKKNSPINRIILAPMEGVIDPLMRKILCSINDYDLCIIEFIRVVDSLLPENVFRRICPELKHGAYSSSKTPLRIQLLGQTPQWIAENAIRAIELGSHGVDINFGCPAKSVNKNKGGAALLKDPEKIYSILSTTKKALGNEAVLSAKIRLGFEDSTLFEEIVSAVNSSGASELAIHARTKSDGYNPPAYWDYINKAVKISQIKIIANGEIWDKESALKCIEASNTRDIMIGRGALSLPNIANTIKYDTPQMSWPKLQELLIIYSELELNGDKSYYFSSRLKQWLKYLKLQYPQAEKLFQEIKRLKNKEDILIIMKNIH